MSKILLVEDDINLREIYAARLQVEGYEVISASDGEEALAIAVRERPDLIISDVMMPKISGFDMLDILRSTPETKNVKVIVMTALSQEEDRKRGEQLGADKYVVKSQVTLDDVVSMVREILGEPDKTVSDTAAGPAAPQPTDPPAAPDNATTPEQLPTSGDVETLTQEVENFVATSPLMNGIAPQPGSLAAAPQPNGQETPPAGNISVQNG